MKHLAIVIALASSACTSSVGEDAPSEHAQLVDESLTPEARLELAQAALDASPDDPHAQLALARALTTQANPQWRKAERHARAAFESGELDAQAGRLLGKIYWENGEPFSTVDAWRVARAADPDAILDSDYFYALVTATELAGTFKEYELWYALREELADRVQSRKEGGVVKSA